MPPSGWGLRAGAGASADVVGLGGGGDEVSNGAAALEGSGSSISIASSIGPFMRGEGGAELGVASAVRGGGGKACESVSAQSGDRSAEARLLEDTGKQVATGTCCV